MLYDEYAERLYDYALSMTGDEKVAADIVHDTFIDACRRAPGCATTCTSAPGCTGRRGAAASGGAARRCCSGTGTASSPTPLRGPCR